MKLRPHHLLCTQGYTGQGYSDDFVENMTAITTILRSEAATVIEVVFATDDLCDKCPRKISPNVCQDNNKVTRFDQKTTAYFGLEEKSYVYQDIIREIKAKITSPIMDDICGDCSWYSVSACKREILG